jgi:hypothetical protein
MALFNTQGAISAFYRDFPDVAGDRLFSTVLNFNFLFSSLYFETYPLQFLH